MKLREIKEKLASHKKEEIIEAVDFMQRNIVEIYSKRQHKSYGDIYFNEYTYRIELLGDDGYSVGKVKPKNFFHYYVIEDELVKDEEGGDNEKGLSD